MTIKIYSLTKKWHKFIPRFLYPLFKIKYSQFNNCFPVSIPGLKLNGENYSVNIDFSYHSYEDDKSTIISKETNNDNTTESIDGKED